MDKETISITSEDGTVYEFEKEHVDVSLLEIYNNIIYGRYDATPCSWFLSGAAHNGNRNLTPVSKSWYETCKYPCLAFDEKSGKVFIAPNSYTLYDRCRPATEVEALALIIKESRNG